MTPRKYTVTVWCTQTNEELVHQGILAYSAEDARFQVLLSYDEKKIGFTRVAPDVEPDPEPEFAQHREHGFCPDFVIEVDFPKMGGPTLEELANLIRELRPRRVLYDGGCLRFTAELLRERFGLPMQPLAKPYRVAP